MLIAQPAPVPVDAALARAARIVPLTKPAADPPRKIEGRGERANEGVNYGAALLSGETGIVEPAVHGESPCFAMLNRDRFDLMPRLAETPDSVRPNGLKGTWDVAVRVAGIANERAALTAVGVKIDKGPPETFYEIREIEVVDPDGHRWCFGQHI